MPTWLIALAIISVLYVLTTTVLLFFAKFKKNEKDDLILDPDSWHFKLSYPILTRKFDSYDIIEYKDRFNLNLNICSYAIKFFFMLYVGWPLLILWSCFKTVVYTPFMILFGYFPVANIESMIEYDIPLAVNVGEILLPEIKGYKIFPIYIVLPIVYFAGWRYFFNDTMIVSLSILIAAIVFAIIIGLVKLNQTNQKEVSLVRAWLSAKKNKVCWKLELASAEEIQGHPLDKLG